jgi:hypothetical protein
MCRIWFRWILKWLGGICPVRRNIARIVSNYSYRKGQAHYFCMSHRLWVFKRPFVSPSTLDPHSLRTKSIPLFVCCTSDSPQSLQLCYPVDRSFSCHHLASTWTSISLILKMKAASSSEMSLKSIILHFVQMQTIILLSTAVLCQSYAAKTLAHLQGWQFGCF